MIESPFAGAPRPRSLRAWAHRRRRARTIDLRAADRWELLLLAARVPQHHLHVRPELLESAHVVDHPVESDVRDLRHLALALVRGGRPLEASTRALHPDEEGPVPAESLDLVLEAHVADDHAAHAGPGRRVDPAARVVVHVRGREELLRDQHRVVDPHVWGAVATV